MQIQETFEVPIPREQVYTEFADVAGIGSCIAGVEDIEVVNDDESRWRVGLTAGFMAVTIDLEAKIVGRRPPEEVKFVATGQNVELAGTVVLAAAGPAATSCDITIDIDPQGGLAPLMVQLGRGPQERLANETISNLREYLIRSGGAVNAAPAPPPADARRGSPPMPRIQMPIAATLIGALVSVGIGFLIGRLS